MYKGSPFQRSAFFALLQPHIFFLFGDTKIRNLIGVLLEEAMKMAEDHSVTGHEEEEEHLTGAFTSSLIVGIIILVIWVSVFMVYIGRI